MKILHKSRGSKIQIQSQRAFFCCDISNVSNKDKLIDDILSMDAGMDCVVSHLENPDGDIDVELLRNDIQGTQVLVLWVTIDLLCNMRSGVFPVEYRIAKDLDIPILPIADYGELFVEFTKLAGAVHGIDRSDTEYRVKLRVQLENLLVSDEMVEKIRSIAFTAEVFLSYRKTDVCEARDFMKMLHSIKEFEAVSVWYDNFLTAGRIFDKEIEKSIDGSDAFVLLATPNLLKKNSEGKTNYVVSTEYPYAKSINKPVVAVEAISIDPNGFKATFPEERLTRMDDVTALRDAFCEKLGASACLTDMSGERAYVLGTAYLKGYGVEKDIGRAIALFELSAGQNHFATVWSANQLREIYCDGFVAEVNYKKALYWAEIAAAASERVFDQGDYRIAETYKSLAQVHSLCGDYPQALENYNKALEIYGLDHLQSAGIYSGMATAHTNQQGNFREALRLQHKALELDFINHGADSVKTAASCNNVAIVYDDLGDYPKALELYQIALSIYEGSLGTEHPNTAAVYSNLAILYDQYQDDYTKALALHEKALNVYQKLYGEEHPKTIDSYYNLSTLYYRHDDNSSAFDLIKKVVAFNEKVYGPEHPNTAMSYNAIAAIYCEMEHYTKALDLFWRAFVVFAGSYGRNHPQTEAAFENVQSAFIDNGGTELDFTQWIVKRITNLSHEHNTRSQSNGLE